MATSSIVAQNRTIAGSPESLQREAQNGSKKTHNLRQNKSTKSSRDCPGIWVLGGGGFVYVLLSPKRRNDTENAHNQNFATRPDPGQSRKFVYVYVFFLTLIRVSRIAIKLDRGQNHLESPIQIATYQCF